MNITIKNDKERFSVRAGAIIFNDDNSKVLLQKQSNMDCYIIPGGRVELTEDPDDAIKRELYEELGINNEVFKLKYIVESFINKRILYHEIGFYYLLKIDENKYELDIDDIHNSMDKTENESYFQWVDIKDLERYPILIDCLVDKIKQYDYKDEETIFIKYRK